MKRMLSTSVNKQAGFTLVEVLASIVLISIILLGVVNLITFTNKTAYSNNSKLVAINLAKASMERIKIEPGSYFDLNKVKQEKITYTSGNCETINCEKLYKLEVNNQTYEVQVEISQNNEEKALRLINSVVTVKRFDKNIQSTVEGYVNYATFEE